MCAMIEIQDLSKDFGPVRAVDGVSFSVARGEVLGFLGPNGAGKSTTMRMATGFLRPTSGSVRIAGHDVATDPMSAKRAMGYLPEGAPGYPDMTPAAFLDFVADIRGVAPSEKPARIAEVVSRVHLEGVLHQPIETLSKGFRRRVGLAQAIVHDPEVLIMDEPTDGLDPNQKHEVRDLIRSMASEKAIIISTHILEEVEAVCTRAIIINQGRLVFDGTPAELEQRSRYHGAVSLRIAEASSAAVCDSLAAHPGVASLEERAAESGMAEVVVFPRPGASIVGDLGEQARSAGWELGEFRVERGRLDEVFRELTSTETAASTGAGS